MRCDAMRCDAMRCDAMRCRYKARVAAYVLRGGRCGGKDTFLDTVETVASAADAAAGTAAAGVEAVRGGLRFSKGGVEAAAEGVGGAMDKMKTLSEGRLSEGRRCMVEVGRAPPPSRPSPPPSPPPATLQRGGTFKGRSILEIERS